MKLPSMPAGIVPTEDGRLLGALDDGLYVMNPDSGIGTFLTPYPAGLGGAPTTPAPTSTAT